MIQIVQCLVCPFCCESSKEQSLICSKLNKPITVDHLFYFSCKYQTPGYRNEYHEETYSKKFGYSRLDVTSRGELSQTDWNRIRAAVEEKQIEKRIISTLDRLHISNTTSKNYHEIIYYLKQANLKGIYIADWKIKYVVDWKYTELANIRRQNETIELLKRTSFNANSFCALFKNNLYLQNDITISYAHSCEMDYEDGGSMYFMGYDITEVCVKEIYDQRYIVLCFDPNYDSNGKGEKAMSVGDVLRTIRNANYNLPVILQNRKNCSYEPILSIRYNALMLYCFIFGINSPK